MLLARQQPQAACDAPRWKWNVGLELELEPGMPPPVAAELQRRGHRIVRGRRRVHGLRVGTDDLAVGAIPPSTAMPAASDSRRDGQGVRIFERMHPMHRLPSRIQSFPLTAE